MDTEGKEWCSWCRLCAKEVAETYLEDFQPNLKEALKQFNWIHLPQDDLFPKRLCGDCCSTIRHIIRFKERVDRSQRMYSFLMGNPNLDSCSLAEVRLKFNIIDDEQASQIESNVSQAKDIANAVNIKLENNSSDGINEGPLVGRITPIEVLFDNEDFDKELKEEDCEPFELSQENTQSDESYMMCDNVNETDDESNSHKDVEAKALNKLSNIRKSKLSRNSKMKARTNLISSRRNESVRGDFYLQLSCLECSDKFEQFSAYCKHIRVCPRSPKQEQQWKCPKCHRSLRSWYNFKRHMRTHIPMDMRKTVSCPDCNSRYTSSAQLESHIKCKHRNDKPFVCEECGICVKTNSNLRQHMLIHTDATPFECNMCHKKFKNNSRLKVHMDTHSPNKHVCAICGLQLNSKATLNRHFLVHSDDMQHKCDYCGRQFKRVKALKNHLLLHTGLKPYSCDFCDRTFANGSNCRSHMKKMHPEQLAALEASGAKTYAKNIPKLEALKAVTKAANNLTPVVTKYSGCFAFGHKPKSSSDGEQPKKIKSAHTRTKKNCTLQVKENNPDFIKTESDALHLNEPLGNATTAIPHIENIYQRLRKQNTKDLNENSPSSALTQSPTKSKKETFTPQSPAIYSNGLPATFADGKEAYDTDVKTEVFKQCSILDQRHEGQPNISSSHRSCFEANKSSRQSHEDFI